MIDINEVKRYLSIKESNSVDYLICKICKELEGKVTPRALHGEFALQKTKEGYLLNGTGIVLKGKLIEKTLQDSQSAILLVVTLTSMSDNMLREYSARDMAKAVILNACMSAYLEEFADEYQLKLYQNIKNQNKNLTRRISCGYGDFGMHYQPLIIKLLKADKYLGVFCNESNMLLPVKSITALVGVRDNLQNETTLKDDCGECGKKDCCYRKN